MSIGNLKDLRRLLVGYEPGSWFYMPDFWAGKPGPRSFMAPNGWDLGPTTITVPRTGTPRGEAREIPHPRHPPGHTEECRINKQGAVVRVPVTASRALLDGSYTCDEPDGELVEHLQRFVAGAR
jgi:hypothetical protein